MTLTAALATLENDGLIRLHSTHPELAYLFRHTLVRDAAYGSLLHRQRRALHRAAGEALEAAVSSDAHRAELAPLLAHHFDEAGDDARALRYLTLAGEAAAAQYALSEAITFFTRALAIARRQPGANSQTLAGLYVSLGNALRSAGQWEAARDNFLNMEAGALASGDASLRLRSLVEQATLAAVFGPLYDEERSQALSEQALALAEQSGDQAARARILWNLMRALSGRDPHRAIRLGTESVALARQLGLREQLAYSLNDLLYAYRGALRPLDALATLTEAQAMWRAIGQQHMLADNLGLAASLLLCFGRLDEALVHASEADQIAARTRSPDMRSLSHLVIALVHFDRGQPDLALQTIEAALQIADNPWSSSILAGVRSLVWSGLGALRLAHAHFPEVVTHLRTIAVWPLFAQSVLGQQARVVLQLGDSAAARALIEEARGLSAGPPREALLASGSAEPIFLAEIELALADNQPAAACALSAEYVAVLRQQSLRGLLPQALAHSARSLQAAAQPDAAGHALLEARAIATEIGQRRTLWAILVQLAGHEAQRGRAEAAAALRAEAAGHVAFIAEHAGSPQLRAAFLGLPSVQAVLHSP